MINRILDPQHILATVSAQPPHITPVTSRPASDDHCPVKAMTINIPSIDHTKGIFVIDGSFETVPALTFLENVIIYHLFTL